MALTRSFKETIAKRAQSDPDFRQAMFVDAMNELLAGNVDLAKSMLKDYINATIRFEPLAKEINKNSKSIQRMLSPAGNPTTKSLFEVVAVLQKKEGIHLHVEQ